MPSTSSQDRKGATARPRSDKTDLYLPPYLNGTVLKSVFLSTVTAAIIAVPPLMSESIAARWLWPRPGFFVFALATIALVSVITLFRQQRFVISSHRRYERSRTEVLRHSERSLDRLYALLDISHLVGKVNSIPVSAFVSPRPRSQQISRSRCQTGTRSHGSAHFDPGRAGGRSQCEPTIRNRRLRQRGFEGAPGVCRKCRNSNPPRSRNSDTLTTHRSTRGQAWRGERSGPASWRRRASGILE
jgi:hypothetical protein